MAYIKNTWVDREGVTRYFETVDEDGALILTPDYAQVTEIGTPVNADNMNHIEEGIASGSFTKFDLNATYFQNDLVTTIEDGSPVIYKSLIDNNIGNNLTDSSFWEKISLGGGGAGLEIGDIGIAPLGIDETKGKRRYLNGSIIIQDQYQVFTQRVKTAIQTYAGLGCTEEEWQTISNMSVGGQCGKFVVDDTAGTIRLPKIIMPIQGLTNLTNLGEIVEAGLPNITAFYGDTGIAGGGRTASGAFSYVETYGTTVGGAVTRKTADLTFDASASNPIYGNSTTVQQEQIQYPYFIQVATGSEYQENITNEIELNNPFVLLEGHYFTTPVYNSSWLQSNAGFTGSLALHPTAYNALLVEQNPNVEVGTTVDNYTKRGLSVKLDTEAYTDYDFVLNTTSQTFRCPLKINKASGRAVVGNGMALGFENPQGTAGLYNLGSNGNLIARTTAYGQATGIVGGTDLNSDSTIGITTDPTKSGIELADSDVYLYFYVGETIQNPSLVNVGRVEEKLSDCITRNDCSAYIVETYQNGSSWYRVYSDGWCEQGGYITSSDNETKSIAFIKSFNNTNYSVSLTQKWSSVNYNANVSVQATSTASMTITGQESGVYWRACGYIV